MNQNNNKITVSASPSPNALFDDVHLMHTDVQYFQDCHHSHVVPTRLIAKCDQARETLNGPPRARQAWTQSPQMYVVAQSDESFADVDEVVTLPPPFAPSAPTEDQFTAGVLACMRASTIAVCDREHAEMTAEFQRITTPALKQLEADTEALILEMNAQVQEKRVYKTTRFSKFLSRVFRRQRTAVAAPDTIWVAVVIPGAPELSRVLHVSPRVSVRVALEDVRCSTTAYWYIHQGKPVNLAATFVDQNIHDGAVLYAQDKLLGGSLAPITPSVGLIRCSAPETDDEACEREMRFHWDMVRATPQSFEYGGMMLPDNMKWLFRNDVEAYTKLAEDVAVLMHLLSRAGDASAVRGAIIIFLKLRSPVSLSLGLMRDWYLAAHAIIFGGQHAQSFEKFLDVSRDMLHNYEKIKKSPLMVKLHSFMIMALGKSLFTDVGMNIEVQEAKIMADLGKNPDAWKSCDFAYLVFETLHFVCERGYQACKLGSIQPLFHSETTYDEWADSVAKLKRWATHLGNPEPQGFTLFQYQSELETAIVRGRSIARFAATKGPREKAIARSMLAEMEMMQASFLSFEDVSKDRIEPLGVLIAGGSSVMKSAFSKIVYKFYGKIMGLPIGQNYRYVRNPFDDYWSNFNTSQWAIHLDDLSPYKPSACQGIDPSIAEALQVINTVAYLTNQAELDNKGRIPVRARLVTASTNVVDLNAHAYFENPLAVRRRFPVVVKLTPKAEYSRNGMIASDLIPDFEGKWTDVWVIELYRVVPQTSEAEAARTVPKQTASLELVQTYTDIDDFLVDLGKMAKRHYEIQVKAAKTDEAMDKIDICVTCHRSRCTCLPAQALTESVLHELPESCPSCQELPVLFETEHRITLMRENGERVNVPKTIVHKLSAARARLCMVRWADWVCKLRLDPNDPSWDWYNVTADRNTVENLFEDYMDAIRNNDRSWYATYSTIFFRWLLECILNYRFMVRVITYFCRWGFTRSIVLSLLWIFLPHRATCIFRLMKKSMLLSLKRHPKLTTIASVASFVLMGHWVSQKLMKQGKREAEALAQTQPSSRQPPSGQAPVSRPAQDNVAASEVPTPPRCAPVSIEEPPLPSGVTPMEVCTTQQIFTPQMDTSSIGKKPEPMACEPENMWSDHDRKTVAFSVSDISASWSGLSWDTIHQKLRFNTALMHFRYTDAEGRAKRTTTRALCLRGHTYLINNHSVRESAMVSMVYEASANVSSNVDFPMSSVILKRFPLMDLATIEVLHVPPRKDITQLFPVAPFGGHGEGMMLIRRAEDVERRTVSSVSSMQTTTIDSIGSLAVHFGHVSIPTEQGDCGSPLIARVRGGVFIVGIHVAGMANTVAAICITREDVEGMLKDSVFSQVSSGAPQLQVGEYELKIGETHSKSHTRWESGTAMHFGSNLGFRSKGKSKVKDTLLRPAMEARGYTTDKCAPNLRSWKPFSLGLKDLLNTNRAVNIKILEQAVDDYVSGAIAGLNKRDPNWRRLVHSYDLETALNGADGVAYVDPINRNTSAGAPCNTTKRNFLIPRADGKYDLDARMVQAVQKIEACYARKERATPVFKAHLKDQAIPKAKVDAEKVRVFVGGPMAWVLVVRMHLLWFIRLAQLNRILFELGAGTVAQSVEWSVLYEYLTQHGKDRIIAGDFRAFDKRMGAIFILYAFYIIACIAKEAGASEDLIIHIMCIGEDTAFAFVDYNGDIFMFFGSNPSGHPLTVIINSLVNSLYMRYVFFSVKPTSETRPFRVLISLYTYGDDNIMGVSIHAPWFTHTVIAQILATIGVEYTMADKESESVPYIDISEASFLKRTWRWDEELGAWMAPLCEESIIGSLMTGIVENDQCQQWHDVCVVQSAITEYWFYGSDVFEAKRAELLEVLHESGLQWYIPEGGLRTYEDCSRSFRRASRNWVRVQQQFGGCENRDAKFFEQFPVETEDDGVLVDASC